MDLYKESISQLPWWHDDGVKIPDDVTEEEKRSWRLPIGGDHKPEWICGTDKKQTITKPFSRREVSMTRDEERKGIKGKVVIKDEWRSDMFEWNISLFRVTNLS